MKQKIKNELKNNDNLSYVDNLLKQFNLCCVEIDEKTVSGELRIALFLAKCDGSIISSDDLELAYNCLYPHFEEKNKDVEFSLELSTPGMDRTIKDVHEFFVFRYKKIKVLTSSSKDWISGIIKDVSDDHITLDEDGEDVKIMIDDIKAAKLIG